MSTSRTRRCKARTSATSSAKGLGEGTRITRYYDPNLGIGGPIKRDKVWYFVLLRKQYSGSNIGGFPVEEPGTFEFQSQLENITEKTTYQLSQNNKLSQFMELRRKLQPSRDASSTRYLDAVYKQESISSYGTVEWNSVVSPAFFMNSRFSSWGYNWPNYAYGPDGNLGENVQPRRTERLTGNVTGGAREDKMYRRRIQIDWSGTYFKDEFLSSGHTIVLDSRASRRPSAISITASSMSTLRCTTARAARATSSGRGACRSATRPVKPPTTCGNMGAFIQDQIVVSPKLTLNAGFRWDYYHVYYPDQAIRESRFRDFFYAGAPLPNGYSIPASFPDFNVPGRDVVLKFPAGFAPRFGVAYDLAGDGKTVLKANWGRYKSNPGPQGFVNPIQSQTVTFEWLDCRNAAATPIACAAGQRGDGRFDAMNSARSSAAPAGRSTPSIPT